MTECSKCHKVAKLTRHHLEDGTIVMLCRSCHDQIHGLLPKEPSIEHLECTVVKIHKRIQNQENQIDDILTAILSRSNSAGLMQGYLGINFEKWNQCRLLEETNP
jgi:hypothetical protein